MKVAVYAVRYRGEWKIRISLHLETDLRWWAAVFADRTRGARPVTKRGAKQEDKQEDKLVLLAPALPLGWGVKLVEQWVAEDEHPDRWTKEQWLRMLHAELAGELKTLQRESNMPAARSTILNESFDMLNGRRPGFFNVVGLPADRLVREWAAAGNFPSHTVQTADKLAERMVGRSLLAGEMEMLLESLGEEARGNRASRDEICSGREETRSIGTSSRDTSRDSSSKGISSRYGSSKDTGSKDSSSRDIGSRDSSGGDGSNRDGSNRDGSSRDTGNRDSSSKDIGSRDSSSRDNCSKSIGEALQLAHLQGRLTLHAAVEPPRPPAARRGPRRGPGAPGEALQARPAAGAWERLRRAIPRRTVGPRCLRCGSAATGRTACAACGLPGCAYCEACLALGRSRACALLVRSAPVPAVRGTAGGPTALRERWGLSAAQAEAAAQALAWLAERPGRAGMPPKERSDFGWGGDLRRAREPRDFLLWAVTGAGKTEMIFPLLEAVLAGGGKALVATPRRDVVLELAPRLSTCTEVLRTGGQPGGLRWQRPIS